MASRFHQRDSRSSLFSSYDTQTNPRSRPSSASPAPPPSRSGYGYGYGVSEPAPSSASSAGAATFGAYPGSSSNSNPNGFGGRDGYAGSLSGGLGGERSKSAQSFEKKGYSHAVLDELESQNDEQVSEMSKRVGMLKDITMKIGDEIRESSALAEKMNDTFGNTSVKLKGTMNRMLRMAEKTGIGWRVWLGFFAFIILLFWYVWLF